jgi:hypothetical protein
MSNNEIIRIFVPGEPSMRIAFDLDDTLIPSSADLFPVERPRGVFGRFLASEWLRRSAPELMHALKKHRCEVWVCTIC